MRARIAALATLTAAVLAAGGPARGEYVCADVPGPTPTTQGRACTDLEATAGAGGVRVCAEPYVRAGSIQVDTTIGNPCPVGAALNSSGAFENICPVSIYAVTYLGICASVQQRPQGSTGGTVNAYQSPAGPIYVSAAGSSNTTYAQIYVPGACAAAVVYGYGTGPPQYVAVLC